MPEISSENANFGNPRYVEGTGRKGNPGVQATAAVDLTNSNADLALAGFVGDAKTRTFGIVDTGNTSGLFAKSFVADYAEGGAFAWAKLDPAGSNNKFSVVARKPGTAGNSISVTLVDPAAASQSLAVTVSGNDVTVSLATDGGSAITSTADLVVAAINAKAAAAALVRAFGGEATTTGVVAAVAKTNLANGTDLADSLYVYPTTNSSGAITMTAAQLIALVANNATLLVAKAAGNDGSGVVNATSSDVSVAGGKVATLQFLRLKDTGRTQDRLRTSVNSHSDLENADFFGKFDRHAVSGRQLGVEGKDQARYDKATDNLQIPHGPGYWWTDGTAP